MAALSRERKDDGAALSAGGVKKTSMTEVWPHSRAQGCGFRSQDSERSAQDIGSRMYGIGFRDCIMGDKDTARARSFRNMSRAYAFCPV